MSEARPRLSWRVPAEVWERFETHVAKKRGTVEPYLAFELDAAMREYLDEDDVLAEAEALLREHTDLRGLSSSTVVATSRYQGADTRKVYHRVDADLKERFQIFADEHDADSYGRALAAALDSYADGGRARRILDDVKRAVAGGASTGTTDVGVETDDTETPEPRSTVGERGASTGTAGDVRVEARHVIAIANEVVDDPDPDEDCVPSFHETDVDEVIGEVVSPVPDVVEAYRESVIDQTGYVEHPGAGGLFVTEAFRESLAVWADMTRPERELHLKGFAAARAVGHGQRQTKLTYRDVQEVVEWYSDDSYSPSHQHAYDLMEALGGESGFAYGRYHGQKQLRVDLDQVEDRVLRWALDEHDADPSDLGHDVDVTTYAAGSAPALEVAGDD